MPQFECDHCAACCRGHLIVQADIIDVLREPRLIESDPYYAGMEPADALTILDDPGRAVTIACGAGRPCRFLGDDNDCTIYPTRPTDCVGLQAGDEQCQYARAAEGLAPLLPIDESSAAEHAESEGR